MFLKLAIMVVKDQLYSSAALSPDKDSSYTLIRGCFCFRTRLEILREEKNFLTWPRVEPRFYDLSLRSLVTGSTELSLFHLLNCLKECIFLNQQIALIKIQKKTHRKIHFTSRANSYMFQHRGDIIREFFINKGPWVQQVFQPLFAHIYIIKVKNLDTTFVRKVLRLSL
jgi:hypothetical protein